ncbi:MAG: putative ABC transporter permease [Bacillota bacterium]|nr:putative ABC transporter permease [Bacillota bacterium]
MSMLTLLLMFAIYGVMGWMTEVIFFTLKTGKFVNRGFLNGPICPLYGFGVVGVVIIMSPLEDNTILLFIGSMLFCTLIEFITGVILKKLFHDTWWDYSNEPFNIGGYVCLRFSIMWGLACVAVIRVLHPVVIDVIEIMPVWCEIVIVCVFYVYAAADLVVTVRGINRVNRRLGEMAEMMKRVSDTTGYYIYEAAKAVDEKSEGIKEDLDEKVDEIKAKGEVRTDAFVAFMSDPAVSKYRRLMRAFPDLRENFKERIIREAGESFRDQIEELFENKFKTPSKVSSVGGSSSKQHKQ